MKSEQTRNSLREGNWSRLLLGLTALVAINTLPLCYGADRGQIQPGQTKASIQLSGPSYIDTWTFFGNAGDRVIINAVETSGTLDTQIYLYPPGGGGDEANTWLGGNQLDWQLQTNGLYTILIEDTDLSRPGTYNLTLMKLPGTLNSAGDPDGGAIASGQTLGGQLNTQSDMDAFQFYGNAGDRVIINAVETSGTLDTQIYLYPPGGGGDEANTWLGGNQLDWQLQTNGLYTILIEDTDLSRPGTYNISLTKMPSTLRPGLYTPRPAVGLTISNSLDLLEWDPVAGATGYDLYFGTNVVAPLVQVGTNFPGASFPLPPVGFGKYYVWHVVAHTAGGLVDGPYWWFTVDGSGIQLAIPILLPDRRCQISLQGRVIEPVRIQAATNLTDWTTLTTLPNLQGNFDYIDSAATNYTRCFYRAVSP
jgi:hypothetical protein